MSFFMCRSLTVPKRSEPLIILQSAHWPSERMTEHPVLLPLKSSYKFLSLSWDFYLSFAVHSFGTWKTKLRRGLSKSSDKF